VSAYSDQDELEKLKEWVKNYGGALLVGVVLGLALLFGNKYWTRYQEQQRAAASALFQQMSEQAQGAKTDLARASGRKLIDDYKRTPYAGMAALLLARLDVEGSDQADARRQLQWAIDHATDPALQHTARLRLGQLYLANRQYQAALALVQSDAPGFEAEYLELKGDAYVGLGKLDDARAAYRAALKNIPPSSQSRSLIEMKLANIGGANPE
jgi:predicted negative regulator of RcsB-dependent stress response